VSKWEDLEWAESCEDETINLNKTEYEQLKADLQAEKARADRSAKIHETYTDANGSVWNVPTAWGYAQACKAIEKHSARADKAEAKVTELVRALEQLKD